MNSLIGCSEQVFLQILGVIAVSVSVIPWILIPVLPLLLVFIFLRRYFLQTSRNIKRLESTSEFPHNATLDASGLTPCSLRPRSPLQPGVRSSPTCPLLFRACGRSERSEQRSGSRRTSTPIRTCTHVSSALPTFTDHDEKLA